MRISRIDINRDDNILQFEICPTALNDQASVLGQVDLVIQSESNVAVLNTGTHNIPSLPQCQDGVCQLGDWKPNRDAA